MAEATAHETREGGQVIPRPPNTQLQTVALAIRGDPALADRTREVDALSAPPDVGRGHAGAIFRNSAEPGWIQGDLGPLISGTRLDVRFPLRDVQNGSRCVGSKCALS